MNYEDKLYGRFHITEPVLQDLITSRAMTRLKGVMQHGITGLIGITTPITRFDHSMGAMLLVRKMGGSLEEQIGALLHDVSHTAFSHVIDYVFDDHLGQSFHDEEKENFVATTDIPAVLAAHGYDWHDFVDETKFPLLEQPSPRLCADRLDYFLRDSTDLGLAQPADVQAVLDDLVVVNGRFATQSLQIARWLGHTFIKADDTSWANFREVGLYELTAIALRHALKTHIISMDDIWGTDIPLWKKLHASNDTMLQEQLRLISPDTQFVWDDDKPTFRVSTKLRSIDPDIYQDNTLQPLSTLDPAFAKHRQAYLSSKQGKWPMRVLTE